MKASIDKGHPVITGIYERKLSGDGFDTYDHIVPFVGYSALNGEVYSFTFHDLFLNVSRRLSSEGLTRSECSQSYSPTQPYSYCAVKDICYGLAVSGVSDPFSELFRAKLIVDMWAEPDWGLTDKLFESPILFNSKLQVQGLTLNTGYSCLLFENYLLIPNGNFLTGNFSKRFNFVAFSVTENVNVGMHWSNGTYFYRCVKNTEYI